jgi:PadR family transcriptional regulator, regulatory protein PadR
MPTEPVAPLLPKNFLRACLLLLLREQPAHGYELLERMQPFGFDGSDPGGLYRTLRGLEEEGLVRSAWQASQAGPDRRNYELTRAGMEALHAQAKALASGTEIMGAFISRYQEFVALKRGKANATAPAKR